MSPHFQAEESSTLGALPSWDCAGSLSPKRRSHTDRVQYHDLFDVNSDWADWMSALARVAATDYHCILSGAAFAVLIVARVHRNSTKDILEGRAQRPDRTMRKWQKLTRQCMSGIVGRNPLMPVAKTRCLTRRERDACSGPLSMTSQKPSTWYFA